MVWGGGWNAAGGLAMMVGMIAVVALVVVGVFLLIRPVFGRADSPALGAEREPIAPGGTGLEVLDGRYARGEITREEYIERRRDLAGESSLGSVR